MAASVSKVDTFLSLRDGFERFAGKTDEIVRALEIELRRLLEEWSERVQKARHQERQRQNDLSDAQRDLLWCQGTGGDENTPDCSYEQARVQKAMRSLAQAQAHLEFVSRSAREIQMACEAFQKHGRALRMMATQTAPNASSHMNILLRDIERTSFIAPAKGNSHGAMGHVSLSVPPPGTPPPATPPRDPTSDTIGEIPNAAYQSRRSSSMRELAALLRGGLAPTSRPNETQIELAGSKLRSIPELALSVWENLLEPQRVAVLCSIEFIMAQLQTRPPLPVIVESHAPSIHGGYDPHTDHIFLSRHFVIEASPHEITEAIIHKGRHAYQAYAMRQRGFHSNQEEVARWRINNLYYLRADIWGDEAYRNQPVERDAFAYTEAIMQQLHGDSP